MSAGLWARRLRRAHSCPGERWGRSVARVAWVFLGYMTAMVAVSAAAYLADEGRTSLYAWIMVAGSVPMALIAWSLARHYFRSEFRSPDAIGVGVVKAEVRAISASIVAGCFLALVATVLSLWFPMKPMEDSHIALMLENGEALKIAWLLSGIIVAPMTEEILFRGVLLGALSRHLGFLSASLISTMAFVTIHLPQLGGYAVAIACIALLGFLAAVARRVSCSIWGSIALHASYNLALAISGSLLN